MGNAKQPDSVKNNIKTNQNGKTSKTTQKNSGRQEVLEEKIAQLKKELILEKDLTSILLKKQREWTKLIESLNPTIEVLGNKIKTLQNDLHLKNQELTNIVQSLSSGLIVTDLKGIVRTFNRAAVSITGIGSENAIGKALNSLFNWSILPPLDQEDSFEKISSGFHQEFRFVKSDRTEIIMNSMTTLMESDESEKQGILINLNDITQFKKFQEEAERRNRLTAMGEIAMQVAHEIRNPLGSIELFVSMMKMDMEEKSNEMELIHHIIAATKSMNHIISNLLEYTKPRPVVLDEVDIHKILEDFLGFANFSAVQQHIDLIVQLAADKSYIKGNGELLKQVFHNLFVNACQAMPEGGTFSIRTENQMEKDHLILERFKNELISPKAEMPVIKIVFEDNGKGMSDEVKKKIFDPFYTTREKGTGLGMSIVHKTMTAHGGVILVDSVVERGTKIALIFPLSEIS